MPILSTIYDASHLRDTAIIIDVFRASNTIIELLAKGAACVIPVKEENIARKLRDLNQDWLLFGERFGKILEGFDGDNSPTAFGDEVKNRTVILTSSGGTQIIDKSIQAQCKDIYIASFANADAVITHLLKNKFTDVSFWAVGIRAEEQAFEDELCARYLHDKFHGKQPNFNKIKPFLLNCKGAQKRIERGQKEDLEYCVLLNIRNVIPKCNLTSNELVSIQDINR